MFLGISLGVPLILVITLRGQKTLFSYFIVSGTYTDSNWLGIFRGLIFSNIWRNSALKPCKRSQEEGKAPGGAPTPLARHPCSSALRGIPASSKSSRRFPWPKNPIYKGPRCVSSRRRRVDQKHHIQPNSATIGGELSSGAATGQMSYPSKIKSLITMMRRE